MKPPKIMVPLREDQTFEYGVSPLQQRLIGSAVVEWSKLEAIMQDLIWSLLNVNINDGRVVTERADPARLIALLRVFGTRYLEGQSLTDLLECLTDADALREDRNFIVHGSWVTLMPENIPMAGSLRPKSEPGEFISEQFPQERMLDIIRRTMKARDTLVRIRADFDASRGKSE